MVTDQIGDKEKRNKIKANKKFKFEASKRFPWAQFVNVQAYQVNDSASE